MSESMRLELTSDLVDFIRRCTIQEARERCRDYIDPDDIAQEVCERCIRGV